MNRFDVKCPICKTLNKSLYLKETDGWMECESCHETVQVMKFESGLMIPIYTAEQLADIYGKKKVCTNNH